MARLVAILCMVYVHVPDGHSARVLHALPWENFTSLIQGLFIEGPGRAAASLLSVISGYLTARICMRQHFSWSGLYKRRFFSILLPMIIWTVATYIVYSVAAGGQQTFIDEATTLLAHLNILLFLTEIPQGATMHLAFLRDLFVCILLAPLLLVGLKKYPVALLSVLGFLYLALHQNQAVIILRPLVLFAFTIGLFLAQRDVALDAIDKYWRSLACVTAFLTVIIMMANGNQFASVDSTLNSFGMDLRRNILYPLCRLFGSLALWAIISKAFSARGFDWAHRLSPYVFLTFCSHHLFLKTVYMGMWVPIFGSATDDATYLVWFVTAPILALTMAIAAVHVASAININLGRFLTGGREPTIQLRMLGAWLIGR